MLGARIRLYTVTLSIANEVVSRNRNVIYDLSTSVNALNYVPTYLPRFFLLLPAHFSRAVAHKLFILTKLLLEAHVGPIDIDDITKCTGIEYPDVLLAL